jgi:D-alanine-D-alanine ligase
MQEVAIICGGFSSEFEISVLSGTNIQKHFPEPYTARLVILQRSGWTVRIEGQEVPLNPVDFTYVLQGETKRFDFAIVYIHGDPGENGKVQAYLEMIQMPYVNSGPLASQLSFDKWYCNQFLKGFQVPVADSIYLINPKETIDPQKIVDSLGLPVFVKPCDSGSSYGIAKVESMEELPAAIAHAFQEGKTVVIERFLKGTEVTCGVYRTNDGVRALPLTEIVSQKAFFDYEAKYKGLSDEITPARIPQDQTEKVQELACKIYSLLQLRSIARIDFMVVDGKPFVIEVNTTPGFSNESIVPKMIAADGKTTRDFWAEILAVELSA